MNTEKEKFKEEFITEISKKTKTELQQMLYDTTINIETQKKEFTEKFNDKIEIYTNLIKKVDKIRQKTPEISDKLNEQKERIKNKSTEFKDIIVKLREKQSRIERLEQEITCTKKYIKYYTNFQHINTAIERKYYYIVYTMIVDFQNDLNPLLNTEEMKNMKMLSEEILTNNSENIKREILSMKKDLMEDLYYIGEKYLEGNKNFVYKKYGIMREHKRIAELTGDYQHFEDLFNHISFGDNKSTKKINIIRFLGALHLVTLFYIQSPEQTEPLKFKFYTAQRLVNYQNIEEFLECEKIATIIKNEFRIESHANTYDFNQFIKQTIKSEDENNMANSLNPFRIKNEDDLRTIKEFDLKVDARLNETTNIFEPVIEYLQLFKKIVDVLSADISTPHTQVVAFLKKYLKNVIDFYNDANGSIPVAKLVYDSGMAFIDGGENYLRKKNLDVSEFKNELLRENDIVAELLNFFKKVLSTYVHFFFIDTGTDIQFHDYSYQLMLEYDRQIEFLPEKPDHRQVINDGLAEAISENILTAVIGYTKLWTREKLEDLCFCLENLLEWEIVQDKKHFSRLKSFLEMILATKNGRFPLASDCFENIDKNHKKAYIAILTKYGCDNISPQNINDVILMINGIKEYKS